VSLLTYSSHLIQTNTTQHNTTQHNTTQHNTAQQNTTQQKHNTTTKYVEIKCQLDATDEFLLQILLLAQHV
jgi:hypothetical protein